MTINYKLRKVNEFKYQIKDGRKVIENITRASGQWAVCCKLYPTIEEAVTALTLFLEERFSAMTICEPKVVIK